MFPKRSKKARSRFHFACILTEAKLRKPRTVMRASQCDQLADAGFPVTLKIGPRDKAPHAVRHKLQFAGFAILEISFDVAVKLVRKAFDAAERRFQVDGIGVKACCP